MASCSNNVYVPEYLSPSYLPFAGFIAANFIQQMFTSSGEAARHETDKLPPSSVEVKNWNGAIGLPPLRNVP